MHALPPLTIDRILEFADAYHTATGDWPNKKSGQVTDTNETWAGINITLRRGQRGLQGGDSLAQLLAKHRSVRNRKDLPPLTIKQILSWADEHKKATGNWPKQNSGQVRGTNETWSGIHCSLRVGRRGLPGGLSLAKLLAEQHNVRNIHDLQPLTIKQVLIWVDAHKKRTGNWPTQRSGKVTGTDETWAAINYAFLKGRRGLPGGSSLSKLLKECRQ